VSLNGLHVRLLRIKIYNVRDIANKDTVLHWVTILFLEFEVLIILLLKDLNPSPKSNVKHNEKKTPWLESASELYRPTERPPLVGEVCANFSE
jgi:hypothetical protein